MPVMPHFTFEVKPIIVRKEYAKGDDFTDHHLSHRVEITAAFRKIRDKRRMSFLTAMPYRVEMNTQPGFRSSFVHEPIAS